MRLIVCLISMAAALGQEFEVVSIKPANSASNGSHSHSDPGMLRTSNVSLKSMIVTAYGMKDYQVEGPDWLDSQRFDVAAKFLEGLPADREKYFAALNAMMRKMLIDRFKLEVHRNQKSLPVYELVTGKNGIKFKEVPPGDSHSQGQNNHYAGTRVTMSAFAEFLTRRMDRPVIDRTGLKGSYDLTLDWGTEPVETVGTDGPSGPTLPIAIQEQLGLKLEMRKMPIEILVVDHAERAPTENE